MSVVPPEKVWDQWLDPENEDVRRLQEPLIPAPAEDFEAYESSTRVNNVRDKGPELIEPVALSS